MADRFDIDIGKFAKHIEVNLKTAVKKISFDVFKGVVEKTPVDTGRARSSWNIAVGQQDSSVPAASEEKSNLVTGSSATSEEQGKANAALGNYTDPFSKVHINSNLDYLAYLEEGSSDQAPQGMVGVTIAEITAHYEEFSR